MTPKTLYFENFILNKKSNIYYDPINLLLDNYAQIKTIETSNENFPKYFYFNSKKIHQILNELEINIKIININKFSSFFYLILLIKQNPYIINYEYSFQFINQFNSEKKNNINFFYKIIKAKFIIELIYNFTGCEEYEESQEVNVNRIENENMEIIKNNIPDLKKLNQNIDEKYIKSKGIDEILIDIIIALIKNELLSDYNYCSDILLSLDFENIDLNELMLKKLSNELNSNLKYMITKMDDFSEITIINFHYILLKFIIKNSIFIYQIPFLFKNRKNIIFLIKSNNIEISNIKIKDKNKLIYIIEKYIDSEYY